MKFSNSGTGFLFVYSVFFLIMMIIFILITNLRKEFNKLLTIILNLSIKTGATTFSITTGLETTRGEPITGLYSYWGAGKTTYTFSANANVLSANFLFSMLPAGGAGMGQAAETESTLALVENIYVNLPTPLLLEALSLTR
jgi:hypothetical protein